MKMNGIYDEVTREKVKAFLKQVEDGTVDREEYCQFLLELDKYQSKRCRIRRGHGKRIIKHPEETKLPLEEQLKQAERKLAALRVLTKPEKPSDDGEGKQNDLQR